MAGRRAFPLAAPWLPHVTPAQDDAYRNFLWAMGMKFRRPQNRWWKLLRTATFERDGWRCTYCGAAGDERTLELDHDIPRAQREINHPVNLRAACRACNRRKSARTGSDMRHETEKSILANRTAKLSKKRKARRTAR